MTDKSAIIVKPSTAQAFETLWKRGSEARTAAKKLWLISEDQ